MIPLKIQLKNFLSYGSVLQVIDFEPHTLICLSGKNGHGKSALLDSITWALWGCARKLAGGPLKADDTLIRLGQSHMLVIFDFLCNNIRYRVKREYSITGSRPITHLDFGIIDPATGVMHVLTDKTIRATQEKIISIVGLSYESFINSAFLRQGQSNEFSKKSPKERKEILAEVLGLATYEQLRKKAAEKAKNLAQECELLTKTTERIATELTRRESLMAELEHMQNDLEKNHAHEQLIRAQREELSARKTALEKITQRAVTQKLMLEQLAQQYTHTLKTAQEKIAHWRHVHHAYLNHKQLLMAHEHREKRLRELQPIAQAYRTKQAEWLALKETLQKYHEEYTKQKSTYDTTRAFLHAQQEQEQKNNTLLHEELKKVGQELVLLEQEIHARAKNQEFLRQQEKSFERRKAFYHTYVARGNQLAQRTRELEEKKKTLDHASAHCPLCEQTLSPTRQHQLLERYAQEEHHLAYHIHKVSHVLAKLKALLTAQHAEITRLRNEQEKRVALEERHTELTKAHARILAAHTASHALLEDIATKLAERPQELTHPAYTAHCTQFTTLETDLTLLAPQESEYHALLAGPTQAALENLATELTRQPERRHEIQTLITLLKDNKRQQAALRYEYAQTIAECVAFDALAEQERTLELQLKEVLALRADLMHKKGALEHQHTLMCIQEKEHKELTTKIVHLQEENSHYSTLSTLLSKDGLQAVLIEEAIPDIEQEANLLLARLTDNQAQLSIDSLRDLKSGGTKETLDIKISDSLGIRPYEMFSGGEAFRIDFALRIALSKLLAHRAGASLQTLIIDEGFGSQDEEGLAHIMDALYKIQDSFSKIIVVSHLVTMKDQFPVHFMVQKTTQGSTITVSEQG